MILDALEAGPLQTNCYIIRRDEAARAPLELLHRMRQDRERHLHGVRLLVRQGLHRHGGEALAEDADAP